MRACLLMLSASPATAALEICCVWWTTKEEALADAAPYTVRSVLVPFLGDKKDPKEKNWAARIHVARRPF